MMDAVAAAKEANKETSGRFATIVWVISGIYLFAATPHASLFSWQAVVFFIVGMFAAAILLGGLFYVLTTALTGMFAKMAGRSPISAPVAAFISFVGVLLIIGNVIGSFLAARWVFHALVG